MRSVGIHVRFDRSIDHMLGNAVQTGYKTVQFFVRMPKRSTLILDHDEADRLSGVYRNMFHHMFVHGSYWINLARETKYGDRFFLEEVQLALRLGADGIVIHLGATEKTVTKDSGLAMVARAINNVLLLEPSATIILENTVHGGSTIGSDINDFYALLAKIDRPERITFAFDTAHAFAYGYDIRSYDGWHELKGVMGSLIKDNGCAVIHLNDAGNPCGSRHDEHVVLGTGYIGIDALKHIVTDPLFKSTPIILELPVGDRAEENKQVQLVNAWI